MKSLLLGLAFVCSAAGAFCQIRFDTAKIKKTTVEKISVKPAANTAFIKMAYGAFDFADEDLVRSLSGKIVKKVQYVYSDYPVGFDYTELNFQRFAALYALLPEVFNKPWVEWEIVRQTDCASAAEAAKLFHGFVITTKDGPAPNTITELTPEMKKELAQVASSVSFTEIASGDDVAKFLAPKEMKITNVAFPAKQGSIRMFSQQEPGGMPFLKGLMMTTGLPAGAIGPNNSPSVSYVNRIAATPDKQLTDALAAQGMLFDLAVVEFDLVIDADSLVFDYVFASEEYPEFLQFNDAFGLFITGPGLSASGKDTTLNLATLPDHITPVSVSAVNHLKNAAFYLPNTFKDDKKLFKAWQYDGFTKVMKAKVKVKRNAKYHIRLVIADYGDPYYDSAIFIDAFGIRTKKE